MTWTLLIALIAALGIALFAGLQRRVELQRMQTSVRERERSQRAARALPGGAAGAQLRHPVVDLSRCLGCGTCVRACPEDDVLELVHGQAVVVNGARCVGHGNCERECPTGAITVTLTNLAERRDVPVLDERLEAVGAPGVFLAGEVTAHALIKPAIEHGTAVAAEVARRLGSARGLGHGSAAAGAVHDLLIVGVGPAGLACALEARRLGLGFVALEQEAAVGGTVLKYPRRKLVLTQPVELPLHGRLDRTTYTKEELVALWQRIAAEHQLPIECGVVFEGLERRADGLLDVRTNQGTFTARHVCLALGRRGTPRTLGVPGEELPKVAYSLIDAGSYSGRRVLVVGGGDSAVEAALGLAEQPGNEVTLSYRRDGFVRIRSRNEERLREAQRSGRLNVVLSSAVLAIGPDTVELEVRRFGVERYTLPNDEVFVLAGGVAPFELLERSGVSFDPELRQQQARTPRAAGPNLLPAIATGLGLALATLAWAAWNSDYYALPTELRPTDDKHAWLRSGRGLGLAFGLTAVGLILVNLLYLLRRSNRWGVTFGALSSWMTGHVVTGILALLCALLHAAMAPRDTAGGHAFIALGVLLVTGAIGRWFYAWIPRAANGRELEIDEVKLRLAQLAGEADGGQARFAERVRREVAALVHAQQWQASFFGRLRGLFAGRRQFRQLLARLDDQGRREGLSDEQRHATLALTRRAHHTALAAAHLEDLRGLMSTWRYLHRWVAVLMLALLVLHVIYALSYGELLVEEGPA